MKISTKGRYALRLILDLAETQGEGFVSLKDVAARQSISKKYLEQIVQMLVSADILISSKGFLGGYRLSKPPEEITVGEVLRVTEGSMAPVECLKSEKQSCLLGTRCRTFSVWVELERRICDYLDSVTIASLL